MEQHNAKWITAPINQGDAVVCFNRTVQGKRRIRKATVHATAMGVYRFLLNGEKVGKAVLAPGWTNYRERVQVQSYDVTGKLDD